MPSSRTASTTLSNGFSQPNSGQCTPTVARPCAAYLSCQSRNCGITFLQLYQPNVQNSTATTRPRRPSILSGVLLIHLPAASSGAGRPGTGWAPASPATAATTTSAAAAIARTPPTRRAMVMRSSPRNYIDSRTADGGRRAVEWPRGRLVLDCHSRAQRRRRAGSHARDPGAPGRPAPRGDRRGRRRRSRRYDTRGRPKGSSALARGEHARGPHERGRGRRGRRRPVVPPRRFGSTARRAGADRGRARRPARRGWRLRAPLRRAGVEPARDQSRQSPPLSPHAQLVRRPGDLRSGGRLPEPGRLSRPAPDGGPRLLAAAQAPRPQRPRARPARDVGAALPRARAVADILLHRVAAGAMDARPGHRALRGTLARAGGLVSGGPRNGPPHPPALVAPRRSRAAPRKLHDLVGPRGGLAEASHRIAGQPRVDLVQPQVDLAVGEGEQAPTRAVALHEERTEPRDLEDPHRLRDAELLEPVDLAHAANALAIGGAHAVADGGEVHRAVRDEPLAVRELGEAGLAHDDFRAGTLEPAAHRLAEAEGGGGGHGLHDVGAVGTDGRRRRAVEVDVGRLADARRHRHAALDDLAIDPFARRVENTREVDDVAQLERGDRGVAHRRAQVHLAHLDVFEARGRAAHSIPSRR